MRLKKNISLLLFSVAIAQSISAQEEKPLSNYGSGFRLDLGIGLPIGDSFEDYSDQYEIRHRQIPAAAFALGANIALGSNYHVYAGLKLTMVTSSFTMKADMSKFSYLHVSHTINNTEANLLIGMAPRIALGKNFTRGTSTYLIELGAAINFYQEGNNTTIGSYAVDSIPGTSSSTKSIDYIITKYQTRLIHETYMPSFDVSFGRILHLGHWAKMMLSLNANLCVHPLATGTYVAFPYTQIGHTGHFTISGSYVGVNAGVVFGKK